MNRGRKVGDPDDEETIEKGSPGSITSVRSARRTRTSQTTSNVTSQSVGIVESIDKPRKCMMTRSSTQKLMSALASKTSANSVKTKNNYEDIKVVYNCDKTNKPNNCNNNINQLTSKKSSAHRSSNSRTTIEVDKTKDDESVSFESKDESDSEMLRLSSSEYDYSEDSSDIPEKINEMNRERNIGCNNQALYRDRVCKSGSNVDVTEFISSSINDKNPVFENASRSKESKTINVNNVISRPTDISLSYSDSNSSSSNNVVYKNSNSSVNNKNDLVVSQREYSRNVVNYNIATPNINRQVTNNMNINQNSKRNTNDTIYDQKITKVIPNPGMNIPEKKDQISVTVDTSTSQSSTQSVNKGITKVNNDNVNVGKEEVPEGGKKVRSSWSQIERSQLFKAVCIFKTGKPGQKKKNSISDSVCWKRIAGLVPGRSPRQCRDRWREQEEYRMVEAESDGTCLFKRGRWSPEEISLLLNLRSKGLTWYDCGKKLNRTPAQCKAQWHNERRRMAKKLEMQASNSSTQNDGTGSNSSYSVVDIQNVVRMKGDNTQESNTVGEGKQETRKQGVELSGIDLIKSGISIIPNSKNSENGCYSASYKFQNGVGRLVRGNVEIARAYVEQINSEAMNNKISCISAADKVHINSLITNQVRNNDDVDPNCTIINLNRSDKITSYKKSSINDNNEKNNDMKLGFPSDPILEGPNVGMQIPSPPPVPGVTSTDESKVKNPNLGVEDIVNKIISNISTNDLSKLNPVELIRMTILTLRNMDPALFNALNTLGTPGTDGGIRKEGENSDGSLIK